MNVWLFTKVAAPDAVVLTGGTSIAPVILDATKICPCCCANTVCLAVPKGFWLEIAVAYNNASVIVVIKITCCALLTTIRIIYPNPVWNNKHFLLYERRSVCQERRYYSQLTRAEVFTAKTRA